MYLKKYRNMNYYGPNFHRSQKNYKEWYLCVTWMKWINDLVSIDGNEAILVKTGFDVLKTLHLITSVPREEITVDDLDLMYDKNIKMHVICYYLLLLFSMNMLSN